MIIRTIYVDYIYKKGQDYVISEGLIAPVVVDKIFSTHCIMRLNNYIPSKNKKVE